MRGLYAVLQLRQDASAEDVQRAYRTLALRYHPDRNPDPQAARQMAAINEAYEVLGEPRRRKEYDRQIAKGAGSADIADAILLAARDLILRGGWRIVKDTGRIVILETGKETLQVFLTEWLDAAALIRFGQGFRRDSSAGCIRRRGR